MSLQITIYTLHNHMYDLIHWFVWVTPCNLLKFALADFIHKNASTQSKKMILGELHYRIMSHEVRISI